MFPRRHDVCLLRALRLGVAYLAQLFGKPHVRAAFGSLAGDFPVDVSRRRLLLSGLAARTGRGKLLRSSGDRNTVRCGAPGQARRGRLRSFGEPANPFVPHGSPFAGKRRSLVFGVRPPFFRHALRTAEFRFRKPLLDATAIPAKVTAPCGRCVEAASLPKSQRP